MHQKFTSPQVNERDWLETVYTKKKNRSFELGVKAIDLLKSEGKNISYRTVASKSKEIDPEGKGIHSNTIINNKELHDYFNLHKTSKTYTNRKKASKILFDDLEQFKNIKPDRDVERVRQRYMQLTKPELIELIIQMEQYVAHQNQLWIRREFENFK